MPTLLENGHEQEGIGSASQFSAVVRRSLRNHSDSYTIVDMASWGCARLMSAVLDDDSWNTLPNLKRLVDEIDERPAAQRALALKDRFTFKMEMDAEATRFLFPSMTGST